ncbi:protein of unknown function [Pseudomonas sp. JV551A1]|uniref:Uncharacterized protein n=1 Tax=Pseudomonas inefficax TaxID=2078786 RepID=A0AAQ1P5C5_9PSED|nr:protein of unknown function [Pseudomonas sp. JV551A1]SPO59568.1 protein of unknown function [Pseudomonas inefficax]
MYVFRNRFVILVERKRYGRCGVEKGLGIKPLHNRVRRGCVSISIRCIEFDTISQCRAHDQG